jgi:hypothetical protein
MARQIGCGQMPQDCSCMNSSSPERKSKRVCNVAGSSIMCVVPLSTHVLSCPQS